MMFLVQLKLFLHLANIHLNLKIVHNEVKLTEQGESLFSSKLILLGMYFSIKRRYDKSTDLGHCVKKVQIV